MVRIAGLHAAAPPTLLCPCAEPGSWVRIKNGLYKGDLAKVVDTDMSTQVGRDPVA
jgi:hypothetical protein